MIESEKRSLGNSSQTRFAHIVLDHNECLFAPAWERVALVLWWNGISTYFNFMHVKLWVYFASKMEKNCFYPFGTVVSEVCMANVKYMSKPQYIIFSGVVHTLQLCVVHSTTILLHFLWGGTHITVVHSTTIPLHNWKRDQERIRNFDAIHDVTDKQIARREVFYWAYICWEIWIWSVGSGT